MPDWVLTKSNPSLEAPAVLPVVGNNPSVPPSLSSHA